MMVQLSEGRSGGAGRATLPPAGGPLCQGYTPTPRHPVMPLEVGIDKSNTGDIYPINVEKRYDAPKRVKSPAYTRPTA